MPELTAVHIGLLAAMLIVGAILGWIFRSDRCAKEKIAVNAGWQKEVQSQQGEHDRMAQQNKSLMEQISQYQASQKDYSNRARELSESLKEAFAQRDQLQRQIKDIRGNLEVAIAQRDRFHSSLKNRESGDQAAALKEKDDKIFRLSRELTSWQSRVPPLVERFQAKNQEARDLAEELDQARKEIARLEELTSFDQTRIEPMDAETLPGGGDASNEPLAVTAEHDTSTIQDEGPGENAGTDIEESGESTYDAAGESGNVTEAVSDDGDDESREVESTVDGDDEFEPENEAVVADGQDAIADAQTDEDSVADDLKLIKGIGPSIEKTLNGLGIERFQQIADMSEFEIDRVAQHLRGFRSRIYREDWIGQARDLHYDKSNKRS